jgi:hypothetical protein
MSFLENINQMLIDAEVQTISEQLFDEWMNANLDEGTFFSDRRFAEMAESRYIKDEFNKHYDLKENDDYYL